MKGGYMVDGWDHGLAAKKADWLAARSAFWMAAEMVVQWDVAKALKLAVKMAGKSAA